jgi:hypothetical protein
MTAPIISDLPGNFEALSEWPGGYDELWVTGESSAKNFAKEQLHPSPTD